MPTTACIIQEKLKLPTSCGALDFNLGCSGFIYGLALAKGLIESGQFGDAAATLITKSSDSDVGPFVFGTDGSGLTW